MIELSIIIPVYNTPEKDLCRCFASIKALQGIRWEVLVVNDGSQSSTEDFCKRYCEKNSGFVYLCKDNGGVSSARNMGLDHARGKYVMFVDADDCLVSSALGSAQFQSDADFVIFDTEVIQSGVHTTWSGLEIPAGEATRTHVLRRYITSRALNGPYSKLFKTALLQDIKLRFNEDFVTAEDWLFGCSFALAAEKFLYVPVTAYLYYRDSGTSLSRLQRFPDKMLENLIAMYHQKLQILEQEFTAEPDLMQLRSIASVTVIENLFNSAADLYLLKKQTAERKARILQICQEATRYLLPGSPVKTRTKAWLLCHFWCSIYPLAHMRSFYLKHKK